MWRVAIDINQKRIATHCFSNHEEAIEYADAFARLSRELGREVVVSVCKLRAKT